MANTKPDPKQQKPKLTLPKRPEGSGGSGNQPKQKRRNLFVYALAGLILVWFVTAQVGNTLSGAVDPTEFTTSQFEEVAKEGRIVEVTLVTNDGSLSGKYYEDKSDATTWIDTAVDDREDLEQQPLEFISEWSPGSDFNEFARENLTAGTWGIDNSDTGMWATILMSFLPLLLIFGLLFFFFTRMTGAGGQGGVMNFGKAKAKKTDKTKQKVTFKDVAGCDEAIQELGEVRDFLADPKRFEKLGARIPKGVLLVGPPGTGKTLLARAVAGEAKVPYFTISGSDFVEMFVGVGASRVRDLFEQAKAEAPAIIFIDEIDAVGRQRGAGLGGGHDEREQTLNALLVEMDGFEMQDNVILLAATNRPDVLDPALLRPGRFDRQVVVDRPDLKGREAILKVHAKNKPLADDVDLSVIARRTPGYTGADLQNLLNEAALLAARANKEKIEMTDVEEGIDRVLMGPERKSRLISEGEKLTIAYHEAGHAIVGHYTPHSDPVHKVTIIPRGGSLGSTWQLPTEDRFLKSKKEMLDDIAVLLSGRAAEEITSGDVTTGASNDIERATKIAKSMVMRFGMSDILGPQAFGEEPENVFLGRDFSKANDHGEETAATIDREVSRIITEGYQRAYDILTREHDMLVLMADELMKVETLEGSELDAVFATGKIKARVEIPPLGEVDPSAGESTEDEKAASSNESSSAADFASQAPTDDQGFRDGAQIDAAIETETDGIAGFSDDSIGSDDSKSA